MARLARNRMKGSLCKGAILTCPARRAGLKRDNVRSGVNVKPSKEQDTFALEKDALAAIARMFGWESCLAHLCGGGTMANLEALWVAGRLRPGAAVLASAQAHYTHQRISSVLGIAFESVPCDRLGRMDAGALE